MPRHFLALLPFVVLVASTGERPEALVAVRFELVRLPRLEQLVWLVVAPPRAQPDKPSQPVGPHLALVAPELALALLLAVLLGERFSWAAELTLQTLVLRAPRDAPAVLLVRLLRLVVVVRWPVAHLVLEVAPEAPEQ